MNWKLKSTGNGLKRSRIKEKGCLRWQKKDFTTIIKKNFRDG
ncbi:MAG: hypothetical protein WC309_01315 [Candidatus Paceibacterota bacterium]